MKPFFYAVIAMGLTLAACGKDEQKANNGETSSSIEQKLDAAAKSAGEAAEKTGDAAKDAAKQTGEAIDDAAQDAAKKVQEATQPSSSE
ncbi:MAG: hypothetical protein E6Q98_03675 [Rhodospirillaceae bacterium]|nr:MAG: hypothetical protein E6Q98_03675 [Rhodospirillaceae bacterium]